MEVQLQSNFYGLGEVSQTFIKITLYTSSNVDFVLNNFEIVMVIKR